VPDLLGQPARRVGILGRWLGLTTPRITGTLSKVPTSRDREYLRRSRLLSTLQLTAVVLTALLVPRGFLPVLDPGTLLGVAGFALVLLVSIILNRRGRVTGAAAWFTTGLFVAIAGSQLATPTGAINFQDLAGYDLLVIPIIIASIVLSSRVAILLWAASVVFVVVDLGLSAHGATLDAFLPKDLPPFLRTYPVAIYPLVLTTVVAVISAMAARSVARALEEADRTAELEQAYGLLAERNRELEEAIGAIQQVHARVANGDLSARAQTRTGDPLLQLAVSLNLTLDRLARSSQATVNLEALEQEVVVLSRYIAELARANLHQPAPAQHLRRLAPLAFGLDQLRLGILQAIQSARALVEKIGAENISLGQRLPRLTSPGYGDDEAIRQLRLGIEAAGADTARLHTYLSRFLVSSSRPESRG
jgi:hypothetical protein